MEIGMDITRVEPSARALRISGSRRVVLAAALGGFGALLGGAAAEAKTTRIRIRDNDKHRKKSNSRSSTKEQDEQTQTTPTG
jgi:hypothetical protein